MNAFRLIINDKNVVLFPGTKVKLVINTGLFKFDSNKPTRTYTFKVPAADNSPIFGVINSVHAANTVREYENAICEIQGLTFGRCKVYVTDWNDNSISIQVVFNEGAISQFLNRSLKSFQYKNPTQFRYKLSGCYSSKYEMSILANGTYTLTMSFRPIGDRYKVITREFTFTYTGDWAILEQLGVDIVSFINSGTNDTGYVATSDPLSSAIFDIYGIGTLREPSNDFTFTSSHPDFEVYLDSNSTVSQSTILHQVYNESLDGSKDYVYAPVYTPSLYNADFLASNPSLVGPYSCLNAYQPKIPGNPSYPGTPIGLIFLAFPFLKNIIYQLHNESGLSVAVDDFFNEETSRLIILNKQPQNSAHKSAAKFEELKATHAFRYVDTVPDVTVRNINELLRFAFNVLVVYNPTNSTVEIRSVDEIMNGESVDVTPYLVPTYASNLKPNFFSFSYSWPTDSARNTLMPTINVSDLYPQVDSLADLPVTPINNQIEEVRFITEINKFYKWDKNLSKWVVFADNLYDLSVQQSTRSITVPGAPLICVEQPYPPIVNGVSSLHSVKTLVAINGETGNNTDFDKNEESIRFAFYRGWLPVKVKISSGGAELDGELPTITNHNYDVLNNKIGDISLSIQGDDGLHNTYWKNFIEKCASHPPMKLKMNLPAQLITSTLFKVMAENREYLIDEIEVEVGDIVGESIVTAYPIIYK